MDPQATWEAMLAALAVQDASESMEHAEYLAAWLRRGGFSPQAFIGLPPDHALHGFVVRVVCDYVLQDARMDDFTT